MSGTHVVTPDMAATSPHFVDHLAPVWHALGTRRRGNFYTATVQARRRAAAHGIVARHTRPPRRTTTPIVIASFGDVPLTGGRPFHMVEHGTGQSYGGEPPPGTTPDYTHTCAMLSIACPNEATAYRNRLHHPHASVAVTGTPKLDAWVNRPPPANDPPVVAFVWHWPNQWIAPESDWAFPHWDDAVRTLAKRGDLGYRLLGHAHPRVASQMHAYYRRLGIDYARTLEDVWRVADVVVFDNTSAGWESAAVGIPVVLLDQPAYRRDVDHGIRFWEHATAGLRCTTGNPDELDAAITMTLRDDPAAPWRAEAVAALYPCLDGHAAARVVDLIESSTLR